MSIQFKKSNFENAADRAPLRADARNMTVRSSERSSTQGQEQNSALGTFHVKAQLGAALVGERNAKLQSLNQTRIQDAESQLFEFTSPSNEEKTQMTASSGKLETSRRKTDKLVDENARLRAEIKALQNERDAAHDALYKMLSDLITTQKELEEKKDDTVRMETELLGWQRNVERLSTELEEKNHQSTAMEKSFMKREKKAIEKKDAELLDVKQKVNRLSAELKEKVALPKDETEVLALRRKVDKLTAELEEKEEQLKKRDNALIEQEESWQAKLYEAGERLETKLKEQDDGTRAEIAEQRVQLKKAEAQLQELRAKQCSVDEQEMSRRLAESREAALLSQVEAEKIKAEQHLQELQQLRASHAAMSQTVVDSRKAENDAQTLQQVQASHAAELEELRRLSNFFKNNSERLSRQTRELMATNRSLQDTFQTKDREIEEQASQIYVLRLQLEELQSHFSR